MTDDSYSLRSFTSEYTTWYHHTETYTPCYECTPLLLQTNHSDLRYEVAGATCFIPDNTEA